MGTQNKNRHDKIYARCFKDLGKGFALYNKTLAGEMMPGTCGYFDHTGAWNKIFQVLEFNQPPTEGPSTAEGDSLTQLTGATPDPGPAATPIPSTAAALPAAVAPPALEVLPSGSIESSDDDNYEWGVKSVGMSRINTYDVDVEANAPGAPVGFEFFAKIMNETREGAVLVTDGKVTYHKAYSPGDYAEWMDRSLPIILNGTHGIAVRKRGLWIVTHTYTTAARAVAVSVQEGQTLKFGVDVHASEVARMGASAEWWSEKIQKPGWEYHVAPGFYDDPPTVDPKNHTVLFMSGIYWKPRLLTKGYKIKLEQKLKHVLAGGGPLQPMILETQRVEDTSPVYLRMTPYAVGNTDTPSDVPKLKDYDSEDSSSELEDGE